MEGHVIYEQRNIASGTFGSVSFGCLVSDPKVKVAIKQFNKNEIKHWELLALREIQLLTKLQGHPNIVKMIMHHVVEGEHYLVMEKCEMSLEDLLVRSDHGSMFAVEEHKSYFQQMMQGIAHCHAHNIVHRDLKPSNLLITRDGFLKLVDFGMSKQLIDKASLHSPGLTTRWYRAPEICLGLRNYNRMIDIWSAGCILGELMYGRVMFPGTSDHNQLDFIWDLTGPPPDVKRYMPEKMQNMIQKRINEYTGQTRERILISKLKEERKKNPSLRRGFLTDQAYALLDRMLQLFPSDRISASDVLNHPYLKEERPAPHTPELIRKYKRIKR